MIDFHSHILPGIDDGSSDIQESIKILTLLKQQGVNTVVATPHYYDNATDIDTFINNRNESYNSLIEAINRENLSLPQILLGAEVYLSPDVVFDKDFEKLCIGDTKCVLVEMPNGFWFDWVYDSISEIIEKKNLIPVIAHLERYVSAWSFDIKKFERLLAMDVRIQINADSFCFGSLQFGIRKLFKGNYVHLIGSDAHNMKDRLPRMDLAHNKIIRRYGIGYWNMIQNNAKVLLSGLNINNNAKAVASNEKKWFFSNSMIPGHRN